MTIGVDEVDQGVALGVDLDDVDHVVVLAAAQGLYFSVTENFTKLIDLDRANDQDVTIESQGESAHEDPALNPAHNMFFYKCVIYKIL